MDDQINNSAKQPTGEQTSDSVAVSATAAAGRIRNRFSKGERGEMVDRNAAHILPREVNDARGQVCETNTPTESELKHERKPGNGNVKVIVLTLLLLSFLLVLLLSFQRVMRSQIRSTKPAGAVPTVSVCGGGLRCCLMLSPVFADSYVR